MKMATCNNRYILLILLNLCIGLSSIAQENCSNGIDDDGDGLVDLNDIEECSCSGLIENDLTNFISNPSFEAYDTCPNGESQIDYVSNWNQATLLAADYFNNCDFMWGSIPQPLPDGVGCLGASIYSTSSADYFEYIGTCLNEPLLTGESYELQLSVAANNGGPFGGGVASPITAGPIRLTIYGFDNCGTMPISTQSCPETYGWYELASVIYYPENQWSLQNFYFVPQQNTSAIMIGSSCDNIDDYVIDGSPPYDSQMNFFYDDISLINSEYYGELTQSGGQCTGDLIFSGEASDEFIFQWYYEGVALEGETSYALNLGESGFDLGMYQLMVTDPVNGSCNIMETEAVQWNYGNPVNFVADITSGCAPLEVSFDNNTFSPFTNNLEWDFEVGASNTYNSVFTFEEPGLYSITLTGETNSGCVITITKEDYIEVYEDPSVNIEYEILEECDPFIVSFSSDLPTSAGVTWDFGASQSSTELEPIWAFFEEGNYEITLESTDFNTGCSTDSSVIIELSVSDIPQFDLSAPEFICENAIDSIEANFENGHIMWADGETGRFLSISEPGLYHAIFTRDDGCQAYDSIYVPLKLLPRITATDKESCEGDVLQLFAESDAPVIFWENVSNTHMAMVSDAGYYTAIAENDCGITSKEILVSLNDCDCHIYIPNSFTPNGDGINDLFNPSFSCPVEHYEMIIMNRWGTEVFTSNDPLKSWNGNSAQDPNYFLESSIFNYIIVFDNPLRLEKNLQKRIGSIQLIR